MASLTGQTIADTYKRLLTIDSENFTADDAAKYIKDGDAGTASALSLSTTRVGIGTDSPDKTLNIENGSSDQLRLGFSNTVFYDFRVDSAGDLNFNDKDGTANVCFQNDGKVGIGVAAPAHELDIQQTSGDTTVRIYTAGANDDPTLILQNGQNDFSFLIKGDESDALYINDGSDTRLCIDASGNVGIGDTSPSYKFEVADSAAQVANFYSSNSSYAGLGLDSTATGGDRWIMIATADGHSSGGGNLSFYNEDTTTHVLHLDVDGNVGIGDASPACKLEVAGAIAGKLTSFTTAGPTNNVDVSGTTMLSCNTTSNSVTIGGLTGGVSGQVLYITKLTSGNDLTLEHNEGGGSQELLLCTGADETVTTYGGWVLVCNGTNWVAVSSPTGAVDA